VATKLVPLVQYTLELINIYKLQRKEYVTIVRCE